MQMFNASLLDIRHYSLGVKNVQNRAVQLKIISPALNDL